MTRHQLLPNLSKLFNPLPLDGKPVEDIPNCPFCHSFDVKIEEWIKYYPYFRCQPCNAGFYKLEQRAACGYYQESVGKQFCLKDCSNRLIGPIGQVLQCPSWKGALTIPADFMTKIKKENRKEDLIKKGAFKVRRIA